MTATSLLIVACLGLPDVLFIRGDVNGDGGLTSYDATLILNNTFILFGLDCFDSGDVNDDGLVGHTDAIYLLITIYQGGLPPRPPFPLCGSDPTEDSLTCEGHFYCETN